MRNLMSSLSIALSLAARWNSSGICMAYIIVQQLVYGLARRERLKLPAHGDYAMPTTVVGSSVTGWIYTRIPVLYTYLP